jgi:hypothetical protein
MNSPHRDRQPLTTSKPTLTTFLTTPAAPLGTLGNASDQNLSAAPLGNARQRLGSESLGVL